MSIFWGFLFSFLYMLWFTLEVIGISWFWKCRFVKSQASVQKNNINLLLSTSWRLMKDSLWWASISLWMPYLPDSFLFQLHNLGWAFPSVFFFMHPCSLTLPPHACASLHVLSYSFTWKGSTGFFCFFFFPIVMMTISNSQYFDSRKKLFQLLSNIIQIKLYS